MNSDRIEIYLPDSHTNWYNFYDGKDIDAYPGKTYTEQTMLEKIVILARGGTIIPTRERLR
jgi:alpha-glucosidase (family GH31 glycosyl hydrolase)